MAVRAAHAAGVLPHRLDRHAPVAAAAIHRDAHRDHRGEPAVRHGSGQELLPRAGHPRRRAGGVRDRGGVSAAARTVPAGAGPVDRPVRRRRHAVPQLHRLRLRARWLHRGDHRHSGDQRPAGRIRLRHRAHQRGAAGPAGQRRDQRHRVPQPPAQRAAEDRAWTVRALSRLRAGEHRRGDPARGDGACAPALRARRGGAGRPAQLGGVRGRRSARPQRPPAPVQPALHGGVDQFPVGASPDQPPDARRSRSRGADPHRPLRAAGRGARRPPRCCRV